MAASTPPAGAGVPECTRAGWADGSKDSPALISSSWRPPTSLPSSLTFRSVTLNSIIDWPTVTSAQPSALARQLNVPLHSKVSLTLSGPYFPQAPIPQHLQCPSWRWCILWLNLEWCFWTVVLEKALKSPLDCKEIKPVSPKGNQPWIFIGRTDAEAEAPILWPPDEKNWLTGKDPDAGKDWRQEEKGITEDEMAGWRHRLDGYESEQALGDGEGQGSLACCSPWGLKEVDTT